jgi:hypothetical protein
VSTDESGGWSGLWNALGKLVVSSGQLEDTVRCVVLNMMGGPHWKRTELVISGDSASQMNERVERLAYQVLAGSLRDDVLSWITQVREAQSQRNNIVHSSWASTVLTADGPIGPAATSSKVRKAKNGMTRVPTQWTPQQIDEITAEVSRADVRGTVLMVELQKFSLAEGRETPDIAPWSR